jgi:hypothetical protein
VGKRPSKDGKRDDSETPTSVVLCNLRIVPEYVRSSGNAHPSVIAVDILISDRQIVEYDVGVQLAARKNGQP